LRRKACPIARNEPDQSDLVHWNIICLPSISTKPRPICRGWSRAAKGEPFVIAKAGKPLVKVTALDAPAAGQVRRLGFMAGEIHVPDDFDRMGSAEIEELFRGER